MHCIECRIDAFDDITHTNTMYYNKRLGWDTVQSNNHPSSLLASIALLYRRVPFRNLLYLVIIASKVLTKSVLVYPYSRYCNTYSQPHNVI